MPSSARMGSARWSALVAAVAVALLAAVYAFSRASLDRPKPRFNAIGQALPEVTLLDLSGASTSLRERVRGHPALIYVMTTAECSSCSNLPLEFEIVRRQAPSVVTLLVGSGATVDQLRPYVRQMHIENAALADPERSLLRALGAQSEPLALLLDSTSRIVLADTRSTSAAAHYPMGEILHDIAGILGETRR